MNKYIMDHNNIVNIILLCFISILSYYIYMNNMKDFQSAITAYRKVVELHQGSGMDANAQFLIGFIFANYINDLDNAKIEYSRFLEQYPDHNLVKDVNFELQYLGKDINQIPVLKKVAS